MWCKKSKPLKDFLLTSINIWWGFSGTRSQLFLFVGFFFTRRELRICVCATNLASSCVLSKKVLDYRRWLRITAPSCPPPTPLLDEWGKQKKKQKTKSAWCGKAAKGWWEQEVRKLSLGALLVLRLPFAFLYFHCLQCTSRQKHHYCSWIPFRWLLGFDAALRKSGCLRAATEEAKWICNALGKRWWLATHPRLGIVSLISEDGAFRSHCLEGQRYLCSVCDGCWVCSSIWLRAQHVSTCASSCCVFLTWDPEISRTLRFSHDIERASQG